MNYAFKDWKFDYCKNMPEKPTHTSSGWKFNFPGRRGNVNMVIVQERPAVLKPHQRHLRLRVKINADDDAKFNADINSRDPRGPHAPAVRAHLIHDMSNRPGFRWFTKVGIDLQRGAAGLDVPLTAAGWSDMYGTPGEETPEAFQRFLHLPVRLALVFGGGWDFGHGVNVLNGSASFRLVSLLL